MLKLFELKSAYSAIKPHILKRILSFRRLKSAPESRIFEELCFCLLTPGAKAENCKRIVASLKKKGLLSRGSREELWPYLKYARFYDQKACRLIAAREYFSGSRPGFKERLFCSDPFLVRGWLVKNVKGLGYKEASHFLRNIGLGQDLAILDRHILKRLKGYGVIKEVPLSLSPKKYLEIEEEMRRFSRRIKIPLEHLDLLFFSRATGKPVKYCK